MCGICVVLGLCAEERDQSHLGASGVSGTHVHPKTRPTHVSSCAPSCVASCASEWHVGCQVGVPGAGCWGAYVERHGPHVVRSRGWRARLEDDT